MKSSAGQNQATSIVDKAGSEQNVDKNKDLKSGGKPWSVVGRHVVITGASDGIGKETAKQLLLKGAKLALVGRNPDKTMRVADELGILAASQFGANPTDTTFKPEVFIADLSKCADIKKVASEIRSRLPTIDILVNNAGGYFDKRNITEDGFEYTFALNHINYFLLTHHLLPIMTQQAATRIIIVSSEAHRGITMEWEDLQSEKSFHAFKAYQRSKLANILFSFALARRLKETNISVNCLHPGFVASKFGHNTTGISATVFRTLQSFFARTEVKGAETSVYLAESPQLSGVTGRYFSNCKIKEAANPALDEVSQERLWSMTENLVAKFM